MTTRAWLLAVAALAVSIVSIVPTGGSTHAAPVSTEVTSGPAWPERGQVALTFDDGPSAYTQAVLDVLADKGVHATFFVIGDYVNASTAPLLEAMSAAGHSVQNHTRSHPHLAPLSDVQIVEQLATTSDRVEQATGVRPSCFRPPYGSTGPPRPLGRRVPRIVRGVVVHRHERLRAPRRRGHRGTRGSPTRTGVHSRS